MPQPLNINDVVDFVERNIKNFHDARLNSLAQLTIDDVLKRKNPYLYKAKNVLTAQECVETIVDAHLSSQEEAIFGTFLESLAIFVASRVYDGRKSSAEGIDLEFEKDGILHIVSIKSGPNWGNSSQIKKMKDSFTKAKRTLQTNAPQRHIIAVNGCCYGTQSNPNQGDYFKFCGEQFWHLISGINSLYLDIVEPLGHRAQERNEEFEAAYAQVLNKFTNEFFQKYCVDGIINWKTIVELNSGIKKK
ncbi:cytosolic protein [bacterium]|nr:cytosolic protein [bacterium]